MAIRKAVFAAGCFWGVEERFRHTEGVIEAVSGYTGGHTDFVADEEQAAAARAAIEAVNASGPWQAPVVTTLEPAATFYEAEEYHQRYLEKHGRGLCPI